MSKEKKYKVLIINQYAGQPNSGWGERHYSIFRHLSSNFETTIVGSSLNHMQINNIDQKERFSDLKTFDSINFGFIRSSKYNPKNISRFFAWFEFAFFVFFLPIKRWKIEKVDYILLSSMSLFPIIACLYLKRKLHAKEIIFEVRDFWPLTPIELMGIKKWNPLIILMQYLERIAYNKSDKIISLPPYGDRYIKRILKMKKRIYHLPNGTERSKIIYSPKTISRENKKRIIYAGTIGFANALEPLIIFLEKKNSITEHFIFEFLGDGYLKGVYEERLRRHDNVIFHGKVRKEDVEDYLLRADFGLICWHNSSLYDLGVSANKYFDYLKCGLPIISLNFNRPDIVKKHNCGFNADNTLDSINSLLKELYTLDKKQYSTLSENSLLAVEEYYFQNLAKKMDLILNDTTW